MFYVLMKLWDCLSQYILLDFKGIFFCARVEGRKGPLFLSGVFSLRRALRQNFYLRKY